MTDPVAEFVRAERTALLGLAPPPHAARVWHRARRARADRLRRGMSAIGWLVRLTLAVAVAASVWWARPDSMLLIVSLGLAVWLTAGVCAPPGRRSNRGAGR